MDNHHQDRRKTDEWFRVLTEVMNEGLFIVDTKGYITYANPAFFAITGYAPEALVGYPITKFFDDSNRSRLLQQLEAHARGKYEPYETGFTRPDGRLLVIHVSPRPLPGDSGEVLGSFAVISDITERKRAEEQLRKLSVAVEQSPVGILITDTAGTIEYANRSICELTGYSAVELIGQNPRLLQSGLTSEETYRSLWSTLLQGREWRGELQDKKKNGDLYWAYELISGIKGEQGNITHYVALQEDISARKLAEDALRESETKYSLLVESSLTGIYIIQEGHFVYVNRQYAAMLGYPVEEMVGMALLTLIVPKDKERIAEQMAKMLAGQTELDERLTSARTQTGNIVLFKQSWVAIEYLGKPAILGNAVDITHEKQTEERLAKSTKQLQVLSQQLLDVLELERKRVASELHDGIGQYLNALKFSLQRANPENCQTYIDGNGAPPCTDLVSLLQEAIDEVRRIAADLRPATLDDLGIVATINWFCRRAQALYPNLTIDKHIDVRESDVPEPLKLVIFRVLQEALNNSVKHAKADTVHVRLEKTGHKVALAITDNGGGFDVAHALRKKSTERGFGLISMRQRVKFSGGHFAIESAPGQGASISAYWVVAAP